MKDRFICAFPGRRDGYQVPVALAETGQLDEFITDFYGSSSIRQTAALLPAGWRERVWTRYEAALPEERVHCLWGTTLWNAIRQRTGQSRNLTFSAMDREFSLAAAGAARRLGSNLMLYHPYAFEAFTSRHGRSVRRVLFQFHPHPELERRILRDDLARHPFMEQAYRDETRGELPEPLQARERDCWQHADLILCASSFTQRSLVEAGADQRKCRVVPYGITAVPGVNSRQAETVPDWALRAVFVGSGYQRKGLHHLLLAWRRANLPAGSRLVLLCRRLDAELERLARETPAVELRRGAPGAELQELYAKSSLLVMPSLIEGFGQVYLEALAEGCPVLGTPNTCLPDLGDEKDGVFLTPAGDVDALVGRLETLSRTLAAEPTLRTRARECAARFTWERFRRALRANINGSPEEGVGLS
jgi:glycosyltransferase involved in cell wall biosynthesis